MQALYYVLLVLHITSAAVLFGGSIGITKNLRQHVRSARDVFGAVVADAARRGALIGIFSFVTLLTGLALIFVQGGFGAVPINIHIGLTLMLGALAVSFTIMRPQSARLVELAAAENVDVLAAEKSIKKLTMGQGILHLLWILILISMIVVIPR